MPTAWGSRHKSQWFCRRSCTRSAVNTSFSQTAHSTATLRNDHVLRLDCKPTGQVPRLMFCVPPTAFLELNKHSTIMVWWLSKYKKLFYKAFLYFYTWFSRPFSSQLLSKGQRSYSNQEASVCERSPRPVTCSFWYCSEIWWCIYGGHTSAEWAPNHRFLQMHLYILIFS